MGANTNPATENAPRMGPPLREDVQARTMLHGLRSPVARLHRYAKSARVHFSSSLQIVFGEKVDNRLMAVLFVCTDDEVAPPLQRCCWNRLHCRDCPDVIKDQLHSSIRCQPQAPLNNSPWDFHLLRIAQGLPFCTWLPVKT